MGTITSYETAKGRRYRVRYRKPDRSETQKRGFRTMRDAQLFVSTVTVSKATGDYIDPATSKAPVAAFTDAWLRSKRPPMSKLSYYTTREQAWHNHVAPVWADREIASIRRSEVQDWVAELATRKSRTVVLRSLGILAGVLDVAMPIVGWEATPRATSATFLAADRASVAYTSRMSGSRRSRHARRIRRSC